MRMVHTCCDIYIESRRNGCLKILIVFVNNCFFNKNSYHNFLSWSIPCAFMLWVYLSIDEPIFVVLYMCTSVSDLLQHFKSPHGDIIGILDYMYKSNKWFIWLQLTYWFVSRLHKKFPDLYSEHPHNFPFSVYSYLMITKATLHLPKQ